MPEFIIFGEFTCDNDANCFMNFVNYLEGTRRYDLIKQYSMYNLEAANAKDGESKLFLYGLKTGQLTKAT